MADLSVSVKNQSGKEIETISVQPEVLGSRVRTLLIHKAVIAYGSNKRSGTASTKTRSEIRKSNKKPWAQKGTGRARSGTRRSPLWRGGGVTFGPKPRKYTTRMNKKQKQLATKSAFLWKMMDQQLIVVDKIHIDKPKTKLMAEQLKQLGIKGSCLIGLDCIDKTILLATRNLPKVKVLPINDFNAYHITCNDIILLTKSALETFLSVSEATKEEATKEEATKEEATKEEME